MVLCLHSHILEIQKASERSMVVCLHSRILEITLSALCSFCWSEVLVLELSVGSSKIGSESGIRAGGHGSSRSTSMSR